MSRVLVVETKAMLDGALRGAIAVEGQLGEVHGWMTLVMRDGVENAHCLDPQPPIDHEAIAKGPSASEALEPVADVQAKGGLAFVF